MDPDRIIYQDDIECGYSDDFREWWAEFAEVRLAFHLDAWNAAPETE